MGTGPDRHVNHAGRVPSNSQGLKKSATYEDRYLVCVANLMNQINQIHKINQINQSRQSHSALLQRCFPLVPLD